MVNSVQYITDSSGQKTGVLLSLKDYEKLLEDLEDLAIVAERQNEPKIAHKEFIKSLKKDGLLPS